MYLPKLFTKLSLLTFVLFSFSIVAQDTEEVTVVGTQIKGASISSALPVSVYSIDDIEALGIDSGDELLEALTEQGQNQFAEASESGGINSSRGDIGAYNLRNIGAGNTLVLLNGRRLVSSPGYQNELIGGGYTPVATVNSNLIPTSGLARLEVLRDGASAIYGADAVTGVVNNVTDTDFEGFTIKGRTKSFNEMGIDDKSLHMQYGTKPSTSSSFTVSYDYVSKGKARARDHRVMSQGDLRQFLPGGNSDPHAAFFDNTSNMAYLGQFDMLEPSSRVDATATRHYVDSKGEFQVLPIADSRCAASESGRTAIYNTGYGTCIVSDSYSGTETTTNAHTKWNKNTYAWVRGETDRHNLLINFSNDFDNGVTTYNEIAYYESNYYSERDLSATYPFKMRVGAASFYNPLRDSNGSPGSSASRALALGNAFDADAELHIDLMRFGPTPKTVSVEKSTYRFLQGISGSYNDWDYDGALVVSQARSLDTSGNRIDFDLMQQALFDTTSAGYNILCDWANTDCSTNIEQTLVNIQKKQTSDLRMIDLKFTNDELFSTQAGPASFLIGLEYREEAYVDDRDPKLDGTITYQHLEYPPVAGSSTGYCLLGNSSTGALTITNGRIDSSGLNALCRPDYLTFPYVGAVAGGTATKDSEGERDTTSLFTELSVPLLDNLDIQVAARYEDTSDFGSEMVGKVAIGYQANDMVLLRASASNTFRAPNLISMNQGELTRHNSDQRDYSKSYTDNTNQFNEWIYRRALSNADLKAETSTNFSFGAVIEPMQDLTFIIDAYSIEKDDTVGNFGTSNEIAIEFLNRYNARTGTADADEAAALARCNTSANLNFGNVYRKAADDDDYEDMSANALSLGMCPLGTVQYVQSQYQNLAERTVEGVDVAAYYDWDNDYGSWSFRYRGAFTTKLEQLAAPGTSAATLQNAIADGTYTAALTALGVTSLPAVVAEGYGSLEGTDSYFEDKHSIRLSWRKNEYSVSLTGKFISDYVQSAVVDSNSNPFIVDSMRTFNLAASYRFDWEDARMKVTLGSNNILDEEAPLADDTFGYDPDVHNNYGRSIYLDVRASF